jgi:SpoVK/Ycf46/Vps4 family AAA+-type ATPase
MSVAEVAALSDVAVQPSPKEIGSGPVMQLAPCQQRALQKLSRAIETRVPVIELRSPSGRGHGITSVLKALVALQKQSALFLGISSTLGANHPEKTLFDSAVPVLREGGLVILDDADVACRPEKLRASRNAGENFQGAGNYAFEDASQPLRLLKSLKDEAETSGGIFIFSSVEEGHARYIQEPFVVRLESAKAEDVTAILNAVVPHIHAPEILNKLAVVPSISEVTSAVLRAVSEQEEGEISSDHLIAAARSNLSNEAAVSPEDVERIDLAELPSLRRVVQKLETHVLFPLLHPAEAKQQALMPKRGVLLHGPPGTGKTTIGRALAHRLQGRFFMIKELLLYKEIFEVFQQARSVAPSVVFFDDIDVLLGGWAGVTGGPRAHDLTRFLLSQMDGLCTTAETQVVVVMAAADAKFLPPAILRSGRIELWLKTEKPKPKEQVAILKHYVEKAHKSAAADAPQLLADPLNLNEVASACEGFVPADLRRLVSDARNAAMADDMKRSGGHYLQEAASDLRAMKEDVEGLVGRMYS